MGDSCRLTVIHDQLPENAPSALYGGWPMILSGLKTLLETGETLTTPGSLMYDQEPSASGLSPSNKSIRRARCPTGLINPISRTSTPSGSP